MNATTLYINALRIYTREILTKLPYSGLIRHFAALTVGL